jgi:aminopeptidase YwaD
LPFSASATVHTEIIRDVMEQGNIWVLPLYADTDQATNPHFEADKYMFEQATDAAKKGASGVIFYENRESQNEIRYNKMNDYEALSIPVLFIRNKTYNKVFGAPGAEKSLKLDLTVSIKKTERNGVNVAAYIDNKAKYTVVLGAHFDHLGYGEDGNSLLANAEKEHKIHHGADDNASGTAALMEEARWVKEHRSELPHYNYLFVHFSGEELGLYGSKAFVKEQALDSNKIAYMLNMDMVGRLNDSTHALQLGGVGSSPKWAEMAQLAGDDFKLVLDSAGVGPSDHASFYNAGIPVLFLFTLQHKDYHKPTDVASSINYPGEVKVLDYVDRILLKMDEDNSKPKYLVTKNAQASGARFKVSLGIMPDYGYQDGGVRVDGVTDNRPAAKAGMQKGDIITQLGDFKISGIYPYMDALSKFKYGDKTTVKFMRDGKEMTLPLEFVAPPKKD